MKNQALRVLIALSFGSVAACGDSKSSNPPATPDGGVQGVGVAFSDPAARGCELLLIEGAGRVESVTFADTVRGTFLREAPRVAVSVVSTGDSPIAQGAVQVALSGDPAGVEVKTVRCVNAQASALDGVTASLR